LFWICDGKTLSLWGVLEQMRLAIEKALAFEKKAGLFGWILAKYGIKP
jgi:hypothetical protein